MDSSNGTVDGRVVKFTYTRPDGQNEGNLSWTDGNEADVKLASNHLSSRQIIGLNSSPDSEVYDVLHVQGNDESRTDSSASPATFRALAATNLPASFVNDFAFKKSFKFPFGFSREQIDQSHPNIHVVVSTKSGTCLGSAVWNELVKPLFDYLGLKQDDEYSLHFTTSDSSVSEFTSSVLLQRANLGIRQGVVLLSGDGGIVDIVDALLAGEQTSLYKKPVVTLVPVGTGNALANSSGFTEDDTLGLSNWFRCTTRELPLFCARFSAGARLLIDEGQKERELSKYNGDPIAYGAVVCSWGHHATLVADSDTTEYRKFGVERFKMAAKEAMFPSDGSPPHVYKGKVLIRRSSENTWEQIRNGDHAYILTTLVGYLEKGFHISPASKPLDGKLRLVHFGPLSGQAAMELMGKAYQGGKHIEEETVGYEEIEAVRIEFNEDDGRWRRVCVDGKIIRVEQGGWVEVSAGQKGVIDLLARDSLTHD